MRARVQDWKDPERSYPEVYAERANRLQQIRRGGPGVLADVLRFYQDHPLEWIEDWAFTLDPRKVSRGQDPFVPLVLFDRQRELIQWIYDRDRGHETGVLEKSRDTGISWCFAAYGAWSWINRPGSAIIFGSYERDKVDKLGVPDSTLEKCRLIVRKLPREFLPTGFDEAKDLLFMRLVNRENGATIVGECGDNIGRGARATIAFVDEAAHLAHPEMVDAGLSATTECKIYASTAHGMGAFYRKVTSGQYPHKFRFHWSQDPRKDAAWYREQERTLDPVILAQEVDIDHTASIEGIVIEPRWVEASKRLREKLGPAESMRGVAGLDIGGGGNSLSVFTARFGPGVRMPRKRGEGDTTGTALWARELATQERVRTLNFDSVGIGAGVASTLRSDDPLVVQERVEPPADPDRPLTRREQIDRDIGRASGKVADRDPRPRVTDVTARIVAVNVGVPASDFVRWPDGKTSREKFANLKAEIWWTARDALQKTYEHWRYLGGHHDGACHPVEELMLLPDSDVLCSQLSTPTWHMTSAGKIIIESKDQLARRGVASPDYAESLVLTYVPDAPGMSVGKLVGAY